MTWFSKKSATFRDVFVGRAARISEPVKCYQSGTLRVRGETGQVYAKDALNFRLIFFKR